MSLFLKKVFFFISFLLVGFITFYIVSCQIINSTTTFNIDKGISKLIMGDSQAECSYNDLFIKNTLNIADSGESYFYTYFKLKKILEDNQQISKIYLEFSNNKMFHNEEEKILTGNYVSRFEHYASFIPMKEHFFLLKKSGKSFLRPFLRTLNRNLTHLMKLENSYNNRKFGGYLKLENSKVDYINKHKDSLSKFFSKRNFFNVDNYKNTYTYKYLQKTIQLCQQKKIKIILMRSPKNSCYLLINSEVEFQKQILQFKDVPFLDFKDFPLKDSDYRDCEHLNYEGAKKISTFFDKTQI